MKLRVPLMAACLVVLLSACGEQLPVELPGITGPRGSDTEQIEAVLHDVHYGMESRKIYRVLAHVSRNYHDKQGRDYAGIQAYLNTIFREYRRIEVTRTRPRIVIQGTRARATETFGTRAEPANQSSYPAVDIQGQVNAYLEKVDGEWKIVEWDRAL